MISPPTDVDELFDLLRRTVAVDGDPAEADEVGPLAHGLQCASTLADRRPDDLELQVAGLVHDVGHLAVPHDADAHGRAGAELVRPLLGDRVADLVELHVPAKRYLVTTDRTYRERLSPGSIRTLELQGGALGPDELRAFEEHPLAADALELRRADEAAKDPGRRVPPLDQWRPIVEEIRR